MQNVDPTSTLLEAFDYDPKPAENPPQMPHMFCSCAEAHPGICKDEACFLRVCLMVQQFQRGLDVHKLEAMSLFKVQMQINAGSAASSSQPGPRPCWLLLGCVSKRLLCHVLGKMVQHRQAADVVTPWVHEHSWTLCTLHEVLVDFIKEAARQRVDPDTVRVVFGQHHYTAVGCKSAPNHFRVLARGLQFAVGPHVQMIPKPAKAPEVKLPFGLQLSAPSQAKRGRPKKATKVAKSPGSAAKVLDPPAAQEVGHEARPDQLFDDEEDAVDAEVVPVWRVCFQADEFARGQPPVPYPASPCSPGRSCRNCQEC